MAAGIPTLSRARPARPSPPRCCCPAPASWSSRVLEAVGVEAASFQLPVASFPRRTRAWSRFPFSLSPVFVVGPLMLLTPPLRRPGRRPDLPLRDVVPRRRPAHLRLLRPARPQGAGHAVRDRAAGLAGGRPTARSRTPTRGRWEFADHAAARHLPRVADRRAVPRACTTSTTASRSASTAGARSPSTWTRTPTRSSTITKAVPRPVPRAVRRALPVRQVRPGVRAGVQLRARWRTPAGRPSATSSSSARRSPTPSARRGPPSIAHEMAHMWFGDLVTMRWWDDLWLNESFAEYLGTRVTAEATRFTAGVDHVRRRPQGLGVRGRPAPVHPPGRAGRGGRRREALLNFDGISYAKGASVLRQLVAWLGDEAFLAGAARALRGARVRQRHARRPARARCPRRAAAT